MKKFYFVGVLILLSSAFVFGGKSVAPVKAPLATAKKSADMKIGYVKLEDILVMDKNATGSRVSLEWIDGLGELEKSSTKGQEDFKRLQEEYKALKEETDKKAKLLDEKARKELNKKLEDKGQELMQLQQQLMGLERVAGMLQQSVGSKIKDAAEKIGKAGNYDLVLAGGALYVKDSLDITNSISSALNKTYKAEKAKETKTNGKEEKKAPVKK